MATTIPGPAESHDNDSTSAETAAGRNVGLSLLEGHSRKVPALRAVACFVRFSKSTTTARPVASISPATGPTTCRPT